MASEIRVDKINSLSGVGTVTLSPTGVDIAGITTAATLRATTGIVTSLTAGSLTSLGAVSGTTGTFSAAVSGTTGTFSSHVSLGDSDELRLGAGNDLKLYHNGNNSFIEDAGTGDFYIRGADNVRIQSYSDNEDMAKFIKDGAVELYHNNAKKLETSSTGATLSGNLSIDANIIHNGDTDTMLSFSAANQADIVCGGTTIGRFTTNGLALGDNKRLDIFDASGDRSGTINNSDSGANALRISADPDNSGSGSHIGFHVDGSEQARIGNGISFNGDTATANFLNDYEEGTWTPVPEFGGSLTGASYSIANCFYTKIGRSVTIKGNINFSSRGSSNGDFKITGVPFNDDFSGSYSHSTGAVIVFFGPNTDGTMNCFTSGTQLRFRMHNEAHANAEPQEADFDNDTKIMFSITYFTNS